MKRMVDFSIITPVYNGEIFVEETIESVLRATRGSSFEYLIIDDGSTDNTAQLVAKYSESVRYIHQDNAGQSAAITNGLNQAQGKYAIVVNVDDPLTTSNLFSDAKAILETNPDIVATYPDWQIIDDKDHVLQEVQVKEFSLEELVGKSNCLIGPGGIFRTELGRRIQGWSPNYRYVPDFDFWLKMSEFGSFQRVPKKQAVWRHHDDSISIKSRGVGMAEERIRVIDEYIERNPNVDRKLKNMALAHAAYQAAVLNYFDPKVPGQKLIFKAIRKYPKIAVEQDKKIVLFLLLLPFSRIALKLAQRVGLFRNLTKGGK